MTDKEKIDAVWEYVKRMLKDLENFKAKEDYDLGAEDAYRDVLDFMDELPEG